MAFFRKIKAGLVKSDIDQYVGEEGNLFFDVESGELRLSDGTTPGGIAVGGGGTGLSLTVSETGAAGTSNQVTNVRALRFDRDTGFNVENLGSGEVKISLGSTFKTWKVDGQQDLVAVGEDTLEFKAGSGIVLTTDPNGSPYKTLTISEVDKTVKLYQDGQLKPTIGSVRWHNPSAIKINKITARLAESPNINLSVIVNKTGSLAESLLIAANADKAIKTVDIDMIDDDYLTVDISYPGFNGDIENNGGVGLSVEFTYSFT